MSPDLDSIDEAEDFCFSIDVGYRTIDVEADSKSVRDDWAAALSMVVFRRSLFLVDERALASETSQKIGEEEVSIEKNILRKGQVFKKFKKGKAQLRLIWANPRCTKLFWGDSNECIGSDGSLDASKAKGYIRIESIRRVWTIQDALPHSSTCSLFKQHAFSNGSCCVSLELKHRTLDLAASDPESLISWVQALNFIMIHLDAECSKEGETEKPNFSDSDGELGIDESEMKSWLISSELSKSAAPLLKGRSPMSEEKTSETLVSQELKDLLFQTQEAISADKSFLYLLKDSKLTLIYIDGDCARRVNHVVEINDRTALGTAAGGKPQIIGDAYATDGFDKAVDSALKYKTTSALIVPVSNEKKEVIGVILFANKQDLCFKTEYFTRDHLVEVQKQIPKIAKHMSHS
jgi:hypothetical protein